MVPCFHVSLRQTSLAVLVLLSACGVSAPNGRNAQDYVQSTPAGPGNNPTNNGGSPTNKPAASGPADATGPSGSSSPDGPSGASNPPVESPLIPATYSDDARHSPLTPYVVQKLRTAIASKSRNALRFAKVGDSNTVNTNHLGCFAGAFVDWDSYSSLATTLTPFLSSSSAQFTRTSLAAGVSWQAPQVLSGAPTLLKQEVDALNARFAFVQFGSNDAVGNQPSTYGRNMWQITEDLLAEGVVPMLGTIPPNLGNSTTNGYIPEHNRVLRAIAQTLQVPLFDVHGAISALNGGGFAADGLHYDVYAPSGDMKGCVFNATGLAYGHNTRNLLEAEALDRVTRFVIGTETAPDTETGTALAGSGTAADPYVITSLPFVHRGDTSLSTSRTVSSYSGCSASQNEGGPEVVYKLVLDTPSAVSARVINKSGVDIDVHVLDSELDGSRCVNRADLAFDEALEAGTYIFSLDTFVSGGVEKSGEYIFMLD